MLIPSNRRTAAMREAVYARAKEIFTAFMPGENKIIVNASESGDEATVLVYDFIGWPFNDPGAFAQRIMSITAKTINVHIHSPGGDLYDGVAMMSALKLHPASVVVTIMGMAASAATIVTMGADEVRMVQGAQFMIHNASMMTWGGVEDLEAGIKVLRQANSDMAGIYKAKTGKSLSKITDWMSATTYFSAEDAKKYGFVDQIIDGEPEPNLYNLAAVEGEKINIETEDLVITAIPADCGRGHRSRLLALTGRMGE